MSIFNDIVDKIKSNLSKIRSYLLLGLLTQTEMKLFLIQLKILTYRWALATFL